MKELKAKLRKLQKAHHPDKNVDKDETVFKKVMEEGEKVLLFIKDHPEMQSSDEDPADIHLLKLLGAGGEVQANKGSYTTILSSAWGSLEAGKGDLAKLTKVFNNQVRKDLLKESEEVQTPVKPSPSEKQGSNQTGPGLRGRGGRGRGYDERSGRGRGFEEPSRRGAALPNRWRGGPSNWGDQNVIPWEHSHHGSWGSYQ